MKDHIADIHSSEEKFNDTNWLQENRGIFLVNLLAIIFDGTRILIGKREFPDPYIKDLTWCFPGGRPQYDRTLEQSLKDEVKKKTNIDIKNIMLYHTRTFSTKPEFLLMYYLAEPVDITVKAGEKFVDAKWVTPFEVKNYFTTDIDTKIQNLLEKLENDPNYLEIIRKNNILS